MTDEDNFIPMSNEIEQTLDKSEFFNSIYENCFVNTYKALTMADETAFQQRLKSCVVQSYRAFDLIAAESKNKFWEVPVYLQEKPEDDEDDEDEDDDDEDDED